MQSTASPKTITIPSATAAGVFASTLSALHGGKVLEDLDDALREITQAVEISGKAGAVVLKLDILPAGQGVGDTPLFKVVDDIKLVRPKKKRGGVTFFADENHNLTRRAPKQTEMPLTVVEAPKSDAAPEVQAKAANS